MKRINTIVTLLCIIQLFSAVCLFAQTGQIRELSGTVELKRAGQAAFVSARTGDILEQNTIVSTGLKSSALIVLGNAVLTVRPLTRLTLAEISSSAGTETINVNLQSGRVRVDVNPPAGTRSNTTVRGPNATASVRGTSFEFDTKMVRVYEGIVSFSANRGRVMLVSAGSSSLITEKEKAASPLETSAVELLPLPPQGSDSGRRTRKAPSSQVEFSFSFTFFS